MAVERCLQVYVVESVALLTRCLLRLSGSRLGYRMVRWSRVAKWQRLECQPEPITCWNKKIDNDENGSGIRYYSILRREFCLEVEGPLGQLTEDWSPSRCVETQAAVNDMWTPPLV